MQQTHVLQKKLTYKHKDTFYKFKYKIYGLPKSIHHMLSTCDASFYENVTYPSPLVQMQQIFRQLFLVVCVYRICCCVYFFHFYGYSHTKTKYIVKRQIPAAASHVAHPRLLAPIRIVFFLFVFYLCYENCKPIM